VKTLTLERDERGVATLVLNRPEKKNAIDHLMFEELAQALDEITRSASDRVLVLAGAGGNFSAGADLGGQGAPERHHLAHMRFYGSVALALHQLPIPTIAAVRGVAVGAGLNLALGCDLIAASDTARFSEIFARRGLSLDLGGSWLLPRLIGMHRAKELALLAEMIPAQEAERIGLVNRVVPDAELDALVSDWAGRLAAGPPIALAMTKRLLSQSFATGLAEALDAEGMAQTVNTASEDTKEAFRAFFQKREPTFRGR
jgi:2-(1,2-epoxy-1,2-dihydrophenyl)acetyl-CoA isomerase